MSGGGSLLKKAKNRKKAKEIMKICGSVGFFLNIFLLILRVNESSAYAPKLSDTMVKFKAVKDKILNGYDKIIRPTKEGSNTTEVTIGLMPRQILEVDEEKTLFIMDSFLFVKWEDERLKWDVSEYDGLLQLPPDLLWKPDITIHNSFSLQVHPVEEVLLAVENTGTVYWIPAIHTQSSCPELLEASYPYDRVTCVVEIGSWVHDGWEVDFTHFDKYFLYHFVDINSRWQLITDEAKAVRNVTYFEGYDIPFVSVHCIFPLKRRTPSEIATTGNPCILIMLLTLSIYWLPTNSSKKIILGGILFLTLVILLVYVAKRTRFPMGAVLAVSFLQSAMYILVTTLLFQIFVIFTLCNIAGPVRPPPAVMQLLTGPVGKYACLRTSFGNDNIPIDRLQLKEDITSNCIESQSPNEDWKLFAAGLDRLFFLLMAVAMITVHHL